MIIKLNHAVRRRDAKAYPLSDSEIVIIIESNDSRKRLSDIRYVLQIRNEIRTKGRAEIGIIRCTHNTAVGVNLTLETVS